MPKESNYAIDAWNRLKKSLDAAIDAAEKPKWAEEMV